VEKIQLSYSQVCPPPSWFNTELIDGIYWIISVEWIVILNY
jgi:hypothetical protein